MYKIAKHSNNYSNNCKSRRKPTALPLKHSAKKARLQFAKKYKDWTEENWKGVVFSDETKINRLGSDGKQWAWVQEGRPLQDHNVNQTYTVADKTGAQNFFSAFNYHYLLMVNAIAMKLY
ncbi:hypothetical protein G6F48_013277 [Rhizopus delemar]|nr:hypothetical protein G6F48_013277 [Rhizopus delemar]